jgi:hypothetical protein
MDSNQIGKTITLDRLLKPLDRAETGVMAIVDRQYKPAEVFSAPNEATIKTIFTRFPNIQSSFVEGGVVVENAVGRIPDISVGEIILAGARYAKAGILNRDQLAEHQVTGYINNENNKIQNPKVYEEVKFCYDALGYIETLKGDADKLIILLNKMHKKEVRPEDLQSLFESMSFSYKIMYETLEKLFASKPGKSLGIKSDLSEFNLKFEKEVLMPMRVEIEKFNRPKNYFSGISDKFSGFGSSIKSALSTSKPTSVNPPPAETFRSAAKPSAQQNSGFLTPKQATGFIKLLEKLQKENMSNKQTALFNADDKNNDPLISVFEGLLQLLKVQKKIALTDIDQMVRQTFTNLDILHDDASMNVSKQYMIEILKEDITTHMQKEIDSSFNPSAVNKQPESPKHK